MSAMDFTPRMKKIAAAVALVVAVGAAATAYQERATATASATAGQSVPAAPALMVPDFSALVAKVSDAVVNVQVERKAAPASSRFPQLDEDGLFGEFFRHFGIPAPDFAPPGPVRGLGSGFIISADGYIVTNQHVIDGADKVTVKLNDKREFEAKVVGGDRASDVALLKIDAQDLPTVTIGDSKNLKVGQWVVAIGAPFGLERTATAGIVSALHRNLPGDSYVPFIQTDVAVNPGNSGGPLFDTAGRVVGINSQIYSRSGGYMGVSFAIPTDVAMNVVQQLKTTGKVERGWLGVTMQEVTHDLARSFGLEQPRGALVSQVVPGSPAEKAGVKVGDIIVGYAGQAINDSGDLPPLVAGTKPGEKKTLTVIREGRQRTLEVRVGEFPGQGKVRLAAAEQGDRVRLNLAISDLTPQQRRELGVERGGVLVEDVGPGIAAEAGVQPGDVILQFDGQPVKDAAQLKELVRDLKPGKNVAILVKRDQGTLFLALKVPDQDARG